MYTIMKRTIALVMLLCLITGIFVCNDKQAEAKSKYVLCGFGKNVAKKYLVTKPKNKYKKLHVKGWAYKLKSTFASTSGLKKRYFNKTFKVAQNCKVVDVEMPNNHVYSYRKYLNKYKIHGDFAGIEIQLLIKDGKVYRIYRSA